jgi:hypothetical protein
MPAANPRVNVVLEGPLYDSVRRLAKRDKVSLSLKVRDLVRDALDVEEDRGLAALADERSRTFVASEALAHDQVWGGSRRRTR